MKARNTKTGEIVEDFNFSHEYGTVSYIDSNGLLRFSTPHDGEWEIIKPRGTVELNTSSPTELTFKDTGEVEKEETIELLNKALECAENDLRDFASEMIELVQNYAAFMPDQVCKQMRNHGEQMKAKVNHGEYRKHLQK